MITVEHISFSEIKEPIGVLDIVSKSSPVESDYKPANLIKASVNRRYDMIFIDSRINSDMQNLFDDATKAGITLTLNSGYRSYELQQDLFYYSVHKYGIAYANAYVALPGQSEHQTGLALDISSTNKQWLIENSHKYGFVLRYVKGKEDLTGFSYESWHFRYVGSSEVAEFIYKNGLVLEEIHIDYDILYYKKQNLDLSGLYST
jgi:D-alanyl-D-alanine carboxypeptidase